VPSRGKRTPAAAALELDRAWRALLADPEYLSLNLTVDEADALRAEGEKLVANYFTIEDPNEINPVGIELLLETRLNGMRLRGIIDRLDLTPDGELVVIDYKTAVLRPRPSSSRS